MAQQGGFSQGGFSQGGFSQGGFSQGGFSQGGIGVPGGFSLADGFANPITMGALVTHRDATVEPKRKEELDICEPKRTDEKDLERWEPWVRAAIAQQELLSDICIVGCHNSVTVESRSFGGVFATLSAPDVADFKKQLQLVLSWAELREERASEILAQIDNQFAFLGAVVGMQPARSRRTFELLAIAIQFAVNVEVRVKHELACWRPVEYSPQVQPMITTPGHGSLPSGHATQAYMTAYVLRRLLNIEPDSPVDQQLQRQAARIATNRVIAGVHFPVDSIAGRLLGQALGEYFVCRAACRQPEFHAYRFMGCKVENVEFHPSRQPFDGKDKPPFYERTGGGSKPATSGLLQHLWAEAELEWCGRKFPIWAK